MGTEYITKSNTNDQERLISCATSCKPPGSKTVDLGKYDNCLTTVSFDYSALFLYPAGKIACTGAALVCLKVAYQFPGGYDSDSAHAWYQ